MEKFFSWVLQMLIPPKPWDGSHTFWFNFLQSLSTVLGATVMALFFLWLIGKMQFLPQLAWADDIQLVQVKVDRIDKHSRTIDTTMNKILALAVRTNISQAQRDVCNDQRVGDQYRLDEDNAHLIDLIAQNSALGGDPIGSIDCQSLLIEQPLPKK